MPVLLPFRAFRSASLYIPGEEPPRALVPGTLEQHAKPALFLYRQRFRFPGDDAESVRDGVMGLLNREKARIFPHEETFPDRVADCARALRSADTDPGSLWLWCDDSNGSLGPLMSIDGPAPIEAVDRFGCDHQIWPVIDPPQIHALQLALEGKSLFLADGHHRFAAGWNLATIQIRSPALRTLASHRLVFDVGEVQLPCGQPVGNAELFLASALSGYSRFVVVTKGPIFRGIEVASTDLHTLTRNATVQPVRGIPEAIDAVQSGRVPMALLVPPFTLAEIECNARRGILLPPKSTDFYPKLAAGLVIHRHQNEKETPPVAHRPGVRNPSS